MKGLSPELQAKSTTNLKDCRSLFEWELYYFCSFCKFYKAHDIFSDVVSGLNVDVYSLFKALYTKKEAIFVIVN